MSVFQPLLNDVCKHYIAKALLWPALHPMCLFLRLPVLIRIAAICGTFLVDSPYTI